MSKIMMTSGGLKYSISDSVYSHLCYCKVVGRLKAPQCFLDDVDAAIECAELFPSYLSMLAFFISCFRMQHFLLPALYALIARCIGLLISRFSGFFVNNSLLYLVMGLYKMLNRYKVDYIIAVTISIFVGKSWEAVAAFVAVNIVCGFLLTILFDSYEQRQAFNDRVIMLILKDYGC